MASLFFLTRFATLFGFLVLQHFVAIWPAPGSWFSSTAVARFISVDFLLRMARYRNMVSLVPATHLPSVESSRIQDHRDQIRAPMPMPSTTPNRYASRMLMPVPLNCQPSLPSGRAGEQRQLWPPGSPSTSSPHQRTRSQSRTLSMRRVSSLWLRRKMPGPARVGGLPHGAGRAESRSVVPPPLVHRARRLAFHFVSGELADVSRVGHRHASPDPSLDVLAVFALAS